MARGHFGIYLKKNPHGGGVKMMIATWMFYADDWRCASSLRDTSVMVLHGQAHNQKR
ncbi:Uncharacterised protein [Serratia ficaria]|nr:Uncharacterised protein [Serratia ficaria]